MPARSTPGSPWMPMPSSVSSSPIWKTVVFSPGIWQELVAKAEGGDVLGHATGEVGDLVQGVALLHVGAHELVGEEDAAHAAALLPALAREGGDVVGALDHARLDVVKLKQLGGHVEVHGVAHVVAKEEQDARAAVGPALAHSTMASALGEVKTLPTAQPSHMPWPT